MGLHVIVLAAGKGTRMKSDLAKVLHLAAGKPLVSWTLDAAASLDPDSAVVVVGHQADAVREHVPPWVDTALQAEQLGTGHAAEVGLSVLDAAPGDVVVVLPGDMPLVRSETLAEVVATHLGSGAAATVLSAVVAYPTGYGRIVRSAEGLASRIVEERDATDAERALSEINTSVYAFTAGTLETALARVGSVNEQGERYLTDVIGILAGDGHRVAVVVADEVEALGVNTVDQLAVISRELARRRSESA
ncbi:MAG: NTP transferase domain-containing protein [Acidimicrobiia bacterium]